MEKISIIVPVYNAEKYLKKCIDSLVNQTYKNLEIILVNDCSKDSSDKICMEYKNKFDCIKYFENSSNSGVSVTRNYGIENATGEYICFVDSDDWVEPNYCETLLTTIKDNNSDCAICGCFYHNEHEHKLVETHVWGKEGTTELVSLKQGFEMYGCWTLNTLWNKIFKADIIKKNNLQFDKNLNMGEDLKLILQYFLLTNEEFLPVVSVPLYHYMRYSGQTLMGSFANSDYYIGLKNFESLKNIVKKYNADADKIFSKKLCELQNTYFYFIASSKDFDKKTKIEKIKKVKPNITKKEINKIFLSIKKEKLYNFLHK